MEPEMKIQHTSALLAALVATSLGLVACQQRRLVRAGETTRFVDIGRQGGSGPTDGQDLLSANPSAIRDRMRLERIVSAKPGSGDRCNRARGSRRGLCACGNGNVDCGSPVRLACHGKVSSGLLSPVAYATDAVRFGLADIDRA